MKRPEPHTRSPFGWLLGAAAAVVLVAGLGCSGAPERNLVVDESPGGSGGSGGAGGGTSGAGGSGADGGSSGAGAAANTGGSGASGGMGGAGASGGMGGMGASGGMGGAGASGGMGGAGASGGMGGAGGAGGMDGGAGASGGAGGMDGGAGTGGGDAGPGLVDECADGTDDCDDNATCTDETDGFSCACNAGYVGDGTACDTCVGYDATADLGSENPTTYGGNLPSGLANEVLGCRDGTPTSTGSGQLLLYTAPEDGDYVFDTLGSGIDTVLGVYDSVPACTSLGCNDDVGADLQSRVVVSLTAGQTVVVVVEGWDATDTGAFTLSVLGCTGGSVACPGANMCIDAAWLCDGWADCSDASDEYPGNTSCGWTCDPTYEGDGLCDCGCGVPDSDCTDGTFSSCEFCSGACTLGATTLPECEDLLSPNNNAVCHGPECFFCGDAASGDYCIDPTWACDGILDCAEEGTDEHPTRTSCEWSTTTCDLAWFDDADDFCDCGCGIPDPDCSSGAATDCDFDFCLGSVISDQNWLCTRP